MAKKVATIMLALSLLLAGCSTAHNKVDVKEVNGFIVLDQKEQDNHTTIVTKAMPADDFGFMLEDGEMIMQNVFDFTDFIILTKEEAEFVELGGIYLVTFDGDDVYRVKENELEIGDKIIGQAMIGNIEKIN